jgi:hypothetical protein
MNNVDPFASLTGVEKRALAARVGTDDQRRVDAYHYGVVPMKCCIGLECGWEGREAAGAVDHMCRITRQRLGLLPVTPQLPLPPASYDHRVLQQFREAIESAPEPLRVSRLPRPSLPFGIRSVRADSLWRHELDGRHIDMLKVGLPRNSCLLQLRRAARSRVSRGCV